MMAIKKEGSVLGASTKFYRHGLHAAVYNS